MSFGRRPSTNRRPVRNSGGTPGPTGFASSNPTSSSRNVKYRRGKGKAKVIRKKEVNVDPKFRKKVKEVLKDSKPTSFFHENHYGTISLDHSANAPRFGIVSTLPGTDPEFGRDQQWVYAFARNAGWSFEMFTFPELMDAFGVLFMNKFKWMVANGIVDTEARHKSNNYNDYNLGMQGTIADCGVNYHIRNNSHRKYRITAIIGSPKSNMLDNRSMYEDWVAGMNDDATAQGGTGNTRQENTLVNISYDDLEPTTVYTLGATPKLNETFRKNWNVEEKMYEVEAGQDFSIIVPGPKNVVFKPKDWRQPIKQDSTNSPGQTQHYKLRRGYSKDMLLIITPELLPTGDLGAGYLKSNTEAVAGPPPVDANLTQMIAVKCEKWFKLKMPEMAGTWKVPPGLATIDQNLNLSNRKSTYYYKTWPYGDNKPLENNIINEQNPDDTLDVN